MVELGDLFRDEFITYVKAKDRAVIAFIVEENRRMKSGNKEALKLNRDEMQERYDKLLEKFVCDNYEKYKSYINERETLRQIVIKNGLYQDNYIDTLSGIRQEQNVQATKDENNVKKIDKLEIKSASKKYAESSKQENTQIKKIKKRKVSRKRFNKIAMTAGKILLTVALFTGIYTAVDKITDTIDFNNAKATYEQVQDNYKFEPKNDTLDDRKANIFYQQAPDFAQLEASYPGLVGYITGGMYPNGFPVMLGDMTDTNTYYLKHLPTGEANNVGSICLDENSDLNLKNDVSYAFVHNVPTYEAIDGYADEVNNTNPMYYYTKTGCYELQPMAYTIEDDLKYGNMSDEEKTDYINDIRGRSTWNSDVTVGPDDNIMGIFTCLDTSDVNYHIHPEDRQVSWFKINPIYENINTMARTN